MANLAELKEKLSELKAKKQDRRNKWKEEEKELKEELKKQKKQALDEAKNAKDKELKNWTDEAQKLQKIKRTIEGRKLRKRRIELGAKIEEIFGSIYDADLFINDVKNMVKIEENYFELLKETVKNTQKKRKEDIEDKEMEEYQKIKEEKAKKEAEKKEKAEAEKSGEFAM